MPNVRVYTTSYCGYCTRAKKLLEARGIPFSEVDVTGDADARAFLVKATGRRTVPQIFIDDTAIGGWEELVVLDRSGELKKRLGEPVLAAT
jgi:glutaredoxin 3